jgi:hypothetical protein
MPFTWLASWIAGRWLPLVVLIAAAGAITAGYFWAYGNGRDAERARWEAATRDAGERFAAALADQQTELAKLDQQLEAARKAGGRIRERYADAVKDDPVARDWDAQPVPDSVRRALGDPAVSADTG